LRIELKITEEGTFIRREKGFVQIAKESGIKKVKRILLEAWGETRDEKRDLPFLEPVDFEEIHLTIVSE